LSGKPNENLLLLCILRNYEKSSQFSFFKGPEAATLSLESLLKAALEHEKYFLKAAYGMYTLADFSNVLS
jgi:hypothetical protein